MDNTGSTPSLKCLVPIRECIRNAHPLSSALKHCLRQHSHNLLQIQTPGRWWIVPDNLAQVKNRFGNCHTVLSDALSKPEECQDFIDVIDSVIHLNAFMRSAGIGGSKLIHHLHLHIMGPCVSSSHQFYFNEMLRSRNWKVLELEPYIEMGNQYFRDASPEDKG